MSPPRDPLVALQYLLPHRLLSRGAYALARWQWTPWKNFFIGRIVAHFKPAMEEAKTAEPPPPAGEGTIIGKVVFKGDPPRLRPIAMDAEPVCAAKHAGPVLSELVVLNSNGAAMKLKPLDAPTGSPDEIYDDIVIFQGREVTTSTTLNGSSSSTEVEGIVYVPGGQVKLNGNGGTLIVDQIIADTYDINGNGKSDKSDGGGLSGNPDMKLTDFIFKRKPKLAQVSFAVGGTTKRVPITLNYVNGLSFDPV